MLWELKQNIPVAILIAWSTLSQFARTHAIAGWVSFGDFRWDETTDAAYLRCHPSMFVVSLPELPSAQRAQRSNLAAAEDVPALSSLLQSALQARWPAETRWRRWVVGDAHWWVVTL